MFDNECIAKKEIFCEIKLIEWIENLLMYTWFADEYLQTKDNIKSLE